jgi:hypothetical protein
MFDHLLVGGYVLICVKVHRLQPAGPLAGSTTGGRTIRMTSHERPQPGPGPLRAASSRFPWQVAFLVLAAIWGCSFYFIKLGLIGLNPIQVAFGRVFIGATTLVILATLSRTRLPRSRSTWRHLFVIAALMNPGCRRPFETSILSRQAGVLYDRPRRSRPSRSSVVSVA